MKKIKDYLVNEDKTDSYISDPRFNNEQDLIAYVRENLGQAVETFLKKNDLPDIKINVDHNNSVFNFKSSPIELNRIGIFKHMFNDIRLQTSQGGIIKHNKLNLNHFMFLPYIYFSLFVSYDTSPQWCKALNDNSSDFYPLNVNRNVIYYDIVNNVILTDKNAPRQWKYGFIL